MGLPSSSLGGGNVPEYRSVPYASGNFTGSGSITWTVQEADHVRFRFAIIGKIARIQIQLESTSVSGTGSELRVKLPFTTTATQTITCVVRDNGTYGFGFVSISGSQLTFFTTQGGGNWAASTNQTNVYYEGEVPLED